MSRSLSLVVVVCALSIACGGGSTPTSPTPPATTTPPPSTTASLAGTVSSSTGGGVPGAVVTIADGVNAGRSTTTSSTGTYRFDNLTAGNGNVLARASGFEDGGNGLFITGSAALNFTLRAIFFNVAGSGNSAFDLPRRSTRALVTGRWNGRNFGTNFIVLIGGQLVVNEILDANRSSYSGTHAVIGGAVEIRNSTDVDSWRITEVP